MKNVKEIFCWRQTASRPRIQHGTFWKELQPHPSTIKV